MCWDGGLFTFERCCGGSALAVGAAAFAGYLGDDSYSKLFPPVVQRAKQLVDSAPGTLAYLTGQLHRTLSFVDGLANETRGRAGTLDVRISAAFAVTLLYFVSREATRRGARLSPGALAGLSHLEDRLWTSFAGLYRVTYGRADYCRCIEGEPWYAVVGSELRSAVFRTQGDASGFARHLGALGHIMGGSSQTAEYAYKQMCHEMEDTQISMLATMGLMLTTGCPSGDIAAGLATLQCFIMDHNVPRILQVLDSLFRLATLAAECHDAEYWQFRVQDVAVAYGVAAWEVVRRKSAEAATTSEVIDRLAEAARREPEREPHTPSPLSWRGCGPQVLKGPLRIRVLRSQSDDHEELERLPAVGPICTEVGQFWLHLDGEPIVDRTEGGSVGTTLAVIPITFVADNNPWHHSHWWIPALWHLRLHLRLRPDEVQVAFVFPLIDADFALMVRTPISMEDNDHTMRRSEPPSWSYFDADWPRVPGYDVKKDFLVGGLHAEVLAMLSTRPARSLGELDGQAFRQVILGVPSMRWTVHTPQIRCPQVRAVQDFVRAAPQLARSGLSRAMRSARKPLLRIVQREAEEGRVIVNLEDVVGTLRHNMGRELRVDVLPTGLLRNASWITQFRLFAAADLVAGAEGASLTWAWALPHGGAVVELRPWDTPNWTPCSRSWDDPAAVGATFPGLSQLLGLHHVCVRMRRPAPQRKLGIPTHLLGGQEWKGADLFFDSSLASEVFREALGLVKGPKPPCEDSDPVSLRWR